MVFRAASSLAVKLRRTSRLPSSPKQKSVSDDNDYSLDAGAQDLLSLYYQVGFLDIAPGESVSMPIATGKKYQVFRLENLGDETLTILRMPRLFAVQPANCAPIALWLSNT